MYPRRLALVLVALGLLLGGALPHAPAARAVGGWTEPTAPDGDTATLLADGRVLFTGRTFDTNGFANGGRTSVYDPTTDRTTPGAMFGLGSGATMPVLLADGTVFFTGNALSDRATAAAQVYDPATDTWTAVAPMSIRRERHTATALPDGSVLVVGGATDGGAAANPPTESVERFDPQTRRWSPAAPLRPARADHTATLLRDGRVLIVGGTVTGARSAQQITLAALYDPRTDTWAAAGSMAVPRFGHQATPLPDGRVLVTGGARYDFSRSAPLSPLIVIAETEIYDPATDRWAPAAPLLTARYEHAAVLLPDSRVLVIGGIGPNEGSGAAPNALTATELYDPARDLWAPAAPLRQSTFRATLLRDGRVLAGGQLYAPAPEPGACFAATGRCVRGRFLAYWLASGGLARHGLPLSDERFETLEDGRAYQVQYFERSRLEYHAAAAPPADVLLGQFGRRVHPVEPPTGPAPGGVYFAATGHTITRPAFATYYAANGGLAQFGYPLGEERVETLEDGNAYTVQYFERARFEYHPEHADPTNEVLLGQLGRRILAEADAGHP